MALHLVSSFPTRRLLPREAVTKLDDHGFLSVLQDTEGFEAFLDLQLLLVVAPPWMGKSFVSKELEQHFNQNAATSEPSPFGRFVHRTNFERDFHDEIMPSWWDEWQSSSGRALWIVDAVDEDTQKDLERSHRLLNAINSLKPDKRAGLCVFMFARENEMPSQIEGRLKEIYGEPDSENASMYSIRRLAPMDEQSARRFLGDGDTFRRVCDLITLNHLQSVAEYPSALECLSQYAPGENVNYVQVWKDVLLDLIKDKNPHRVARAPRTPDLHQFEAAARIGAILTFSDCDAVRETDSYRDGPSIDGLIPLDHAKSQLLNLAGRDVIKAPFFRRTFGGFQFAQKHVREWFAAFGVARLSLSQLRPLLSDQDGKALPIHRGVMSLLLGTNDNKAVRDWIIEQHGGVPPRSDAAPWDLAHSLAALDRLQTIVKTTAWGLSFWNDRGLKFLATHGLGEQLATRLRDKSLSTVERELMIEVAIATGSVETVPAAIEVALDNTTAPRLRDYATTLVIVLGNKDNWLALAKQAAQRDVTEPSMKAMRGELVLKLYESGAWDYATAVREAPPPDSRSRMLYFHLEKDMTVANARSLLASVEVEQVARELNRPLEHDNRHSLRELFIKAIELLAEQPSPPTSDYDLLLPIAILELRPDWKCYDLPNLSRFIARNREARRQLTVAAIDQSPVGTNDAPARFLSLVVAEDIDWLINLAIEDERGHAWLWGQILQAATWREMPADVRERARSNGLENVPEIVQQIDKDRARFEEQEREREREEKQWKKQNEVEVFAIGPLADQTLGSDEIPLRDKMHRLSWFCFCDESLRPTNINGKWEDLDADQQQSVLTVCERALRECGPTPIPGENSYPATIAYEAHCFAKVGELRENFYQSEPALIEKWLQSAIVLSTTNEESLVARCYAESPDATERVLLRELRRCLSFSPQSILWMDSLPPEIWRRHLCESFAGVAGDDTFAIPGRAELLRRLLVQNEASVLPILEEWIIADDSAKRIAAVDLLIAAHPEKVWQEFKKQIERDGKAAFLRIRGITNDHRTGLHTGLSSWTATRVEELHGWLMEVFPPTSDPVRESGRAYGYGLEDAYRDLRKQLPPLLHSRGTADDLAALDRMATQFEATRNWYDHIRAQAAAGLLLGELRPEGPLVKDAPAPFAKVSKLLDVAIYRLVRTSADLQMVLVEEISAIASDAKEHLSCLYYPRKATKSKRIGAQESLHEDALQAYLHCRLSDRLKGRVLEQGARVILNREPLTTKDQRLDIKVEAPTLSGGIATVVIELKWSAHPKVSTSLRDQLGQEYLINGNVTHGIYLIGWNSAGRWRDKTVPAPADLRSPEAWRNAFIAQAKAFSQTHATISIIPLVIDLAWPGDGGENSEKARKATPKTKDQKKEELRASSRSRGGGSRSKSRSRRRARHGRT